MSTTSDRRRTARRRSTSMPGQMQHRELTIPLILHRAEEVFPHSRITTRTSGGDVTVSYRDWAQEVRRLASGLVDLGLEPGDRVATIAGNSYAHLALYFAAPCAGMVLHTVNHRLAPEHLAHVLTDADARTVFVEDHLLDQVLPVLDSLSSIENIVVIGDVPVSAAGLLSYDAVVDRPAHGGDFAEGDERAAASICYTSGTTGAPKGVVYTHRSVVLHALMILPADVTSISEHDVVMPIVPMFHANAWGMPYASILAGADLVLPGVGTAPGELVDLLEKHDVTVTGCVPTVWRSMLPDALGRRFPHLRRAMSGGGPIPSSLAEQWRERHGVTLSSSWGMTELGPSGTAARVRPKAGGSSGEPEALLRPGTPPSLVRLRVGDAEDGGGVGAGVQGEIQVSGPTTASGYHGGIGSDRFTVDGWLRTGDLGQLTDSSELTITDRLKDVIKSGGEWISTIDLENAIMENPEVAEAAVIGVPHERWDERPVAFVVPRPEATLETQSVRDDLRSRVASWWIPEDVIVVPKLPRNSTGKISKADLRLLGRPGGSDGIK